MARQCVGDGRGTPWGAPTTTRHDEGVDVGYYEFPQNSVKPFYAFGRELSYTSFKFANYCDFW